MIRELLNSQYCFAMISVSGIILTVEQSLAKTEVEAKVR